MNSMKNKVYQPETIIDNPFSQQGGIIPPVQVGGQVYSPEEIPETKFPLRMIAVETIGQALDTQSKRILGNFVFGRMGAMQIGKYAAGVSGDIKISPNGIVGRDSSGTTTFSVDGTTGNATFKGTVAAGSIVTGYIAVGGAAGDVNAGSTTISGGKITTNSIAADRIVAGTFVATGGAAGDVNNNATTISGGKITTGSITADRMNVSSLSAISANLGSVVVGGSADSLGTIVVKNSAGTEIAKLNNSGIIVRNTRGLFWESATGGNYGSISNNASSQLILNLPSSNQFFMTDDSGTTNLFTVSATQVFSEKIFRVNANVECKGLNLGYGQLEGNINNVDTIFGYNDIKLNPAGTNKVIFGNNIDMNEKDIDACQTIWAYNFSNRSDVRLKNNIATRTGSLSDVLKLRPVSFNYKKDGPSAKEHVGLIAQEVEMIFPNFVMSDDKGIKGIAYNELIPVLVGAIQELHSQVEQLKLLRNPLVK